MTPDQYCQRNRARSRLGAAVSGGQIPPAKTQLCVKCGAPAEDYHHPRGYAPEHALDVEALCHGCHLKAHRAIYDELRKQSELINLPDDPAPLVVLEVFPADVTPRQFSYQARRLARAWASEHPDDQGYLIVSRPPATESGYFYRIENGKSSLTSAESCRPRFFAERSGTRKKKPKLHFFLTEL